MGSTYSISCFRGFVPSAPAQAMLRTTSGSLTEGSSLVRQDVFPDQLDVPINLQHNGANNASLPVKKAQASRYAPVAPM